MLQQINLYLIKIGLWACTPYTKNSSFLIKQIFLNYSDKKIVFVKICMSLKHQRTEGNEDMGHEVEKGYTADDFNVGGRVATNVAQ